MLITIVISLVVGYLGLCVLLYVNQRSFIYLPPAPIVGASGPAITLKVPGALLRIAVRPLKSQNALIYFGGNAEDVSFSLADISNAFPDYAIYMMNYRGYGGSSGKPSEGVLHSDAQALFEMVRAEHTNIVVVGRSLGTGVAIRLASIKPVKRLVLVTPYDSIQNLAKRQFAYFPVGLLLRDKFESWRYASRITASTLLVVAGADEVIPRDSTDALFKSFPPGIATMKIIENAGHNTISSEPDYMQLLRTM